MSVDRPATGGPGYVRDWMSRTLVTVPPTCPVGQVARLMRREGIRHVLVVDGGRLVGLVSHRDVRGPLPDEPPSARVDSPVALVMSEGPVTAAPDTPLLDAGRAMLERKIGALPVMEAEQAIGILTRADVLEALLAWAERTPAAR